MSPRDIVRSWKDPEFRSTLSEAERAALPTSPAGVIEFAEPDLRGFRRKGLHFKTTLKAGGLNDTNYCHAR